MKLFSEEAWGVGVGVEDFDVFFVAPLGIPMVFCRGEHLTGKFYILEKFEIFGSGTGPRPGRLIGRYNRLTGPLLSYTGPPAAIAGLYRILAITLAIR